MSDPVGTNYFRVVNGTAEQTSVFATATPSTGTASGSSSVSATSASAEASATGNAATGKGVHDMVVAGWAGVLALPLIL